MRRLVAAESTNILTASRQQLDLRDQSEVSHWFKANRPDYVFLVAGTVGGIMANSTRPAEFIYDNLMIHGTVVHAAHEYPVTKLLYLGPSGIEPNASDANTAHGRQHRRGPSTNTTPALGGREHSGWA